MKSLYVGRKYSREGSWTSFEADQHLTMTHRNIYGRCVPCMENLLSQLVEGKQEIELGQAFNCWKVVAVLNSEEECLEVLEKYQERFLSSVYLQGRFGSSKEHSTKAIVINTDNEKERDIILLELEECAKETNPNFRVFCARACGNLYGEVLGNWKEWQEVTPIKYPENIEKIIKRIRKLLYEA